MTAEKRFQVFISSTFRDLVEERQAVLKAVLELDHMPAGMELFPATDESAWQLIKDVIDGSDYYVLIMGGRYGSLDETGIGYTEKEYEHAVSLRKPVIPLLHEDPNNLPREKTETDEAAWKKLQAFRKKVEQRHTCVYWCSAGDLKAKVIVGLTSTVKRHPAIGWIRADQVPSGATLADILTLRERVSELEKELERTRSEPPPGTEDLLQGDDSLAISFRFEARRPGDYLSETKYKATINPAWNEIFAGVAPSLINEASNSDLRRAFIKHLSQLAIEEFQKQKDLKDKELLNFAFADHDIDTCIVQFRALGLIRESDRKRSIKDTATYWSLTSYGDRLMVQLRALRKAPTEHQRAAGTAEQAPDDEAT
jgi:hypothetical protein